LFVACRSATAPQAEVNAALHGGVGYHYPWESGTSGAEVTPETCPAENPRCHWNHLFVTAGVAYGIRLYYSTTRDYDYMVNTVYAGCEVSMNIAKFLANQAVYNPEHARYDMNGMHSSTNSQCLNVYQIRLLCDKDLKISCRRLLLLCCQY